jgi:hypothetical protein
MNRKIFVLLSPIQIAISVSVQQTELPKLDGSCLGQKPRGMTPDTFAPGILLQAPHGVAVFSPDGHGMSWVPG